MEITKSVSHSYATAQDLELTDTGFMHRFQSKGRVGRRPKKIKCVFLDAANIASFRAGVTGSRVVDTLAMAGEIPTTLDLAKCVIETDYSKIEERVLEEYARKSL